MNEPVTDWSRLHGSTFADRPVCVTGGAGFIGSHVVSALVRLGARVTVIDDLSTGFDANVDEARVTLVRGSILDRETLARAVDGCALVFHLAALGSVPHSLESPREYHDVNATGTLNVLEAARDARATRVIYSASSSAYGDAPQLPKTESMPPAPRSPYAASKLAGEAYLAAWAHGFGLDTVSLRYFNIFGPRQNANSAYAAVIAAFAKRLLAGESPVIFGDGETSRDFTYVDNAVHANLLAARARTPLEGDVFNIATARRISLNTLAELMARTLGRTDLKPTYEPERAGDVRHSEADLSRANSVLGYDPIVSFEQGLEQTVAWYRETLG